MARLTQAQKDAYIKELESKIEEADKIKNDQLNILDLHSCPNKKKHKKIEQKSAQLWLIIALLVALLLSAMNVYIMSIYVDLFKGIGGVL